MAAQDFDINSVLEVSYNVRESGKNKVSSPAPKSSSNEGDIVPEWVSEEDWGRDIKPKEENSFEDSNKLIDRENSWGGGIKVKEENSCEESNKLIDGENSWCEESSVPKVILDQQILNEWDCNASTVGEHLAVSPVNSSHTAATQVSSGEHYRCTTCSEVFSDSSLISKHSRTHPPRKMPFACNICGKKVTELCNLKRHVRFHTGEPAAACSVCNKMFHTRDMLKKHMEFHSGNLSNDTDNALNKFQCHICMRPFARLWHLNRHIKFHSVETQFIQMDSPMQQIQQQS